MWSAPCPVLGSGPIDTNSDNRKSVFYVVRAIPSAGQRANRHAFWHVACVFCAAWSDPQLYKGASLKEQEIPVWRRGRIPPPWDSKIWSQVPRDSNPRKNAQARASSTYKRQTRPLVREGAPQEQNRNCHTSNKDLVVSLKWVLYSKTDWPADRRS
jgi:hypothetical protein